MSNQTENGGAVHEFGANDWMFEELYERFVEDKNSVDPNWWPTLEKYAAKSGYTSLANPAPAQTQAPASTPTKCTETQPVATTTTRPAQSAPIPADAPIIAQDFTAPESEEEDVVTSLKGMPKSLSQTSTTYLEMD